MSALSDSGSSEVKSIKPVAEEIKGVNWNCLEAVKPNEYLTQKLIKRTKKNVSMCDQEQQGE